MNVAFKSHSPAALVAVSGMRKLIRSKNNGMFINQSGTWTPDLASAQAFADCANAAAVKQQFHLENVELYYSFDGRHKSHYDFALTL